MKQNLRLWGLYGLKRTQSVSLTKGRLYLPDYAGKPNRYSLFRRLVTTYITLIDRYTDNKNAVSAVASAILRDRSQTAAVFLGVYERFPSGPRAGFQQRNSKMMAGIPHEDPTMMRSVSGAGTPLGNVHTEAAHLADGVRGKAQPVPCPSPPSLIPYPCDIPMIPVCIPVKRPKNGTLPRSIRQTYGRNAHSDRQSVGLGSGWDRVRDRFESASEVSLHSMQPCTALRLAAPNGVQSERKINPVEDQTKHPSHSEGDPVGRWSAGCPLTAQDWFEFSRSLVRQLLAIASAFSRSVAEGFSKASRTLVEALSKDCRTSLEQQSNNSRRNIEESCVCTHAKVPARSGLGLALGLVLSLCCGIAKAQFHKPSEVTVRVGETLPESFFKISHQAVDMQTGEETILRLEDYHDKLIILDFWATWCSPCIYSLNKLDTISQKLQDDGYVIIPVTYQSIKEASNVYKKYGWDFTGIVGDTVLGSVFPHRGLPHMVWIKDGKVVSMPQTSYVDSNAISAMLGGELPDLPQQPKDIDTSQPMVSGSEQGYSGTLLYQSSVVGGDAAFAQHGVAVEEHDGHLILNMCNMPLFGGLVFEAFRSNFPEVKLSRKRIVWDMDSISKAKYTRPKPRHTDFEDLTDYRTAYERWVANHMYSYSLKMPVAVGRAMLFEVMKRDLCLFIATRGLEVTLENRPEATLVIREKRMDNNLN